MMVESVISALALPGSCRVNQRIPKKLLAENGGVTATDKRRLADDLAEVTWAAVLKPETVGVPAYRDDDREYLEISVVTAALRPGGSPARLHELIHRAIPYPIVLIIAHDGSLSLSLAHKRWSQNESGKTVLEDEPVTATLMSAAFESEFMKSLKMADQPRTHLHALYQGWLDTLIAFQVARISGSFAKVTSLAQSETRRLALHECIRLESEIARLRAAASKEKQLPRQVGANLEIQRLKNSFNLLKTSLLEGNAL